jgi:hypothetical protein
MKNEKIIGNVILIVGAVLCVKYVVIPLATVTFAGIGALTIKREFNKRMKKGLKDGSIVKINGQYYEVEQNTVEEDD